MLARVSDRPGWEEGWGQPRLAMEHALPWQGHGVPFMETSARAGMNVELAFLAIAK